MESIRRTLVWRLQHLRPLPPVTPPRTLHLLPSSIRDPFGRPIIIMSGFSADDERQSTENLRATLAPTIELLRKYLKSLNDAGGDAGRPILQFIIVLDLEGVSIQHVVRLSTSFLLSLVSNPSP